MMNPRRLFQNPRGLLAAAVTVLLAASTLAGDPVPPTSDHLKKWLEKFPETDADHDGILTPAEIWEYLATAPQRRAEQLKKGPAKPLPDPIPLKIEFPTS